MEKVALYRELAQFYDRIYASKDYAGEARRLTALARKCSPNAKSLLDVACGTGRHLQAFRALFEVEGLDASRSMLAVARRRLGRSAPLHVGDMRTFRRPRQFDVIVCLFSAIGYLTTPADRERTFRNFYRHLHPGGVALVEGWLFPSEYHDRSAHVQVYDGPDAKIARVSVARRHGGISTIDMEYLIARPGGRIRHVRERHREALVEPGAMLATMRSTGFRARVLRSGEYRSRGLYVGIRPPERDGPGRRR